MFILQRCEDSLEIGMVQARREASQRFFVSPSGCSNHVPWTETTGEHQQEGAVIAAAGAQLETWNAALAA